MSIFVPSAATGGTLGYAAGLLEAGLGIGDDLLAGSGVGAVIYGFTSPAYYLLPPFYYGPYKPVFYPTRLYFTTAV